VLVWLCGAAVGGAALTAQAPAGDLTWPEPTRLQRPWTRWWWPGGAVDRPNLTRELEGMAAAGIGGVEITPIYGARGAEDRYLPFLSPQYMATLEHACREAQRLGLGVDMATGTGWPLGGPWVSGEDADAKLVVRGGVKRRPRRSLPRLVLAESSGMMPSGTGRTKAAVPCPLWRPVC
jgi:hypothetical protein